MDAKTSSKWLNLLAISFIVFSIALLVAVLTAGFVIVATHQQSMAVQQYEIGYQKGVKDGIDQGIKEAIIIMSPSKANTLVNPFLFPPLDAP